MMNIRERKLIVHFLKQHLKNLEQSEEKNLDPLLKSLLSRKDMLEIFDTHEFRKDLAKSQIKTLETEHLFDLIRENIYILSYFIQKVQNGITVTPNLSREETETFFDRFGLYTHYLREKPSESWDEYDRSNYYSLLLKHGKVKKVFAIFTDDVKDKDEDKYTVSTKPKYFFDTLEEAELELERIISKENFLKEELKIMSLWQIK